MTPERRTELKQQCGSEPTLRATLADLNAELAPKLADIDALLHKKTSLLNALAIIDGIKAELAVGFTPAAFSAPIESQTGESPSLSGDSQTQVERNK